MRLTHWLRLCNVSSDFNKEIFLFFIVFILLASYTTLNIFIAIVVNTMSEVQQKTSAASVEKIENIIQDENEELREDIRLLRDQIVKIEEKLTRRST